MDKVDDKKNVISWVCKYAVTNPCCNEMQHALSSEWVVARAAQPGVTPVCLTTPTGSSWHPFKMCPWCGYELDTPK